MYSSPLFPGQGQVVVEGANNVLVGVDDIRAKRDTNSSSHHRKGGGEREDIHSHENREAPNTISVAAVSLSLPYQYTTRCSNVQNMAL